MQHDLTVGNPRTLLIKFSIPMIISMIFQQMYNIADSVIAGRMISVDALAAIGAAYPATVLFLAVAVGASVGSSVVVSRRFGEKNIEAVQSTVYTAFISITLLAIILTIIGFITMKPLLTMISTPKNIFNDALEYLYIYMGGVLFVFLYNAANSAFNALGDSKTPLYLLIFSSVLNVILDILFVLYIDKTVQSLAWATFLAQGVSSIMASIILIKRVRRMQNKTKVKLFDYTIIPVMAGVAVPSICQQSFVSVGIFLVQGVINGMGEQTVAAFAAALKISTFACMIINTQATALTSYAGQNIGAGQINRVKEGLKSAIITAIIFVIIINIVLFSFGDMLVGAFIEKGSGQEVIILGERFLHMVAPFYLLIAVKNCCDSVLRGGGAMGQFMATTCADLVLRVIFTYAFASTLGFYAVCIAYPFGWVIGTVMSVWYYKGGKWKALAPKKDEESLSESEKEYAMN